MYPNTLFVWGNAVNGSSHFLLSVIILVILFNLYELLYLFISCLLAR